MSIEKVRTYLLELQDNIVATFSAVDGSDFQKDQWKKRPGEQLQGEGITCMLEGGGIFERAGCGFSQRIGLS
jgi:coproporphyrinogen III oxidase